MYYIPEGKKVIKKEKKNFRGLLRCFSVNGSGEELIYQLEDMLNEIPEKGQPLFLYMLRETCSYTIIQLRPLDSKD